MNMSFLSGLRCLPWLPLFAALILTGCSETAGMRLAPVSSVSGTVSYKERIALSPDAELVVLLYQRTPDGRLRVAEDRTPTAGRNVPLPFRVVVSPENTATSYELEAAIMSGGSRLFFTPAPITVEPGQNDVAVWTQRVIEPAAFPPDAAAAELAGTRWLLTEVGGQPARMYPGQPEAHLLFTPADNGVGRISGSDGCNNLVGSYTLNGTILAFDHMGSTMRLCPQGDAQARALTSALGQTTSLRLQGNRLELMRGNERLATFEARNL